MICPKCGAHIKRFNLKPNCSSCGVNIMLYTQEQDLTRDAKKAELEYAKARIFVAKLKAAFISGKLTIARLIMVVLCLGVLALPFASLKISVPLFEADISLGAIGVYKMISSGIYAVALDLAKIPLVAPQMKLVFSEAAAFAALALCAALIFAVELLSFINIKKTAKIIAVISAVAALFSAAAEIIGFMLRSSAGGASFLSASAGIGGFVAVPVFIAMLVINMKIADSDIKMVISENDALRAETLKKVKLGEVLLDDLPLPVYETEEEREKRIEAFLEDEKRENGGVAVE